MNSEWDIISQTGLQFFGKMSASISHEIKNALAIMNESAGLLNDLAEISLSNGMPLDPEKNKSIVDRMTKQIQRANDIIKSMNQFAHSPDDPLKEINLCDITNLVLTLSRRFASMKCIQFIPTFKDDAIQITTNPFLLEALIFHCLNCVMGQIEKGTDLSIIVEKTQDGAIICFTPFNLQQIQETFPSEKENALMDKLHAKLSMDLDQKNMTITLPKTI